MRGSRRHRPEPCTTLKGECKGVRCEGGTYECSSQRGKHDHSLHNRRCNLFWRFRFRTTCTRAPHNLPRDLGGRRRKDRPFSACPSPLRTRYAILARAEAATAAAPVVITSARLRGEGRAQSLEDVAGVAWRGGAGRLARVWGPARRQPSRAGEALEAALERGDAVYSVNAGYGSNARSAVQRADARPTWCSSWPALDERGCCGTRWPSPCSRQRRPSTCGGGSCRPTTRRGAWAGT